MAWFADSRIASGWNWAADNTNSDDHVACQ